MYRPRKYVASNEMLEANLLSIEQELDERQPFEDIQPTDSFQELVTLRDILKKELAERKVNPRWDFIIHEYHALMLRWDGDPN